MSCGLHSMRELKSCPKQHERMRLPIRTPPRRRRRAPSRGPKDAAFLVTQDESLWPQIGQGLDREWSLKQVDTIDELQRTTRAGQAGIVVWDARDQEDRAGGLSRLQLHSMRFAIIVLDSGANGDIWRPAIQQRQIVAHLGVPFDAAQLLEAFSGAREECHARSAVLGDAARRR
jgi:hypothetical protein